MKIQKWLVLGTIYITGLVVVMNEFKAAPLFMALIEAFDINYAMAGLVMAAFSITAVLLALPAFFIIERIGPNMSGTIGLGCVAAGCFLGGIALSTADLMVGRIVEGVGLTLTSFIATLIIPLYFRGKTERVAMGILATVYPLGAILTYVMAIPVTTLFHTWRGNWWIGGLCALFALALYFTFVEYPDAETEAVSGSDSGHYPEVTDSKLILTVLRTRRLWLLSGILTSLLVIWLGFFLWAPVYFNRAFAYTAAHSTSLTVLGFFFMIPGGVAGKWLARHIGTLKFVIIMFIGILSLVIFSVAFYIPSAYMSIYLPVSGFLAGAMVILIFSWIPHIMKTTQAVQAGRNVLTVMFNLAALLAGPIYGFWLEKFSWNAAISLNILFSALCLILLTALWWDCKYSHEILICYRENCK